MKKILTLLVAFFVLFGASMNLYAFSIDDISLSDFDDFALEQVQKIFSSNLSNDISCQSKENTQNTKSDFELCFDCYNDMCLLNQNINFKTNNFYNNVCYKPNNYVLLFYDTKTPFLCRLRGLSEYKIKLNTYMAITVPDNNLNFTYNISYAGNL